MQKEFVPFELERLMSVWENQVAYNLSESGVHPLTIEELVEDPQVLQDLLSLGLTYPQANGILALRENIAAMYPGASVDNVLVTTGCAQANFTAILTMMEADDEIAIMLPNYMQIWGVAQNLKCKVRTFSLKEELGWGLDEDDLNRAVGAKTKLIAVVNPNNPTGHILSSEEMQMIVAAADKSGAWLLSDEVYAGAERVTDEFTPTFWGGYERVIATGSMSKAYGLPGLRIGWIVAPSELIMRFWAWQDYITIGASMLGNHLAAYALSPEIRPKILARTRKYIRDGYVNLEGWIEGHEGLFSLVPPQAAAISFMRYNHPINATELVHQLIKKDVLVIPGDLFGLDHFLRISYGLPAGYLNEGLDRLSALMKEL